MVEDIVEDDDDEEEDDALDLNVNLEEDIEDTDEVLGLGGVPETWIGVE